MAPAFASELQSWRAVRATMPRMSEIRLVLVGQVQHARLAHIGEQRWVARSEVAREENPFAQAGLRDLETGRLEGVEDSGDDVRAGEDDAGPARA